MTRDQLKDVIHSSDLSRLDVLITLLAVDNGTAKDVRRIKELGVYGGLRQIKKWNVSDTLRKSGGLAVRTPAGWELSAAGGARARVLSVDLGPIASVNQQLRAHLESLSPGNVRAFVEEAVNCLEAKYLRAAVVLSWVGTVAYLYEYVLDNKLAELNAECKRRNAKWKTASTADDLSRLKEYDFLQILEAISVFGKNVKHELEQALKLRNACGHPNSLEVGESRVAAHIEVLLLNVFARLQ